MKSKIERRLRFALKKKKLVTLTGHLTKFEYLTERVIMLRSMTPRPTEEEIVSILTKHFDALSQNAARVQNITMIQGLGMLLQREDLRNQHSNTRNHNDRISGPNSLP